MLSTKSIKFGSRYLVHRLLEWDEIWQIDRSGLAVHRFQDGGNSQVDKNFFCNTFLVHHLAKHGGIWHDDGHWSVADLKPFW